MRLITWNIQWGRGVDGRVDLGRIARAVKALGDFDVMCFQEVADNYPELAGNDDADQFAKLPALFPGYRCFEGIAIDVADGERRKRFGNLILTRLPVHSARRHALPWPADPGKDSMPRVAVEIVVAAPIGALRITTTHLEYYSGTQRMAQARRLRELHDEGCDRARNLARQARKELNATFDVTPQPEAAILTGDFNFPPQAPEYPEIQAPLASGGSRYRDAWTLAHGLRPHDPTFCVHDHSWKDTPYCCDFIFVTEGVPVRSIAVDAEARESDHQPVLLEVGDTTRAA
jgi:endonuclease/exonuclease/phosphatase family metal-dependent hydrolase